MSLKKIAEMTGASPATVSRVLNSTSEASPGKELHRRIWKAAREIGYLPNEAARNLRKSNEETTPPIRISVILARIDALEADPFFEELFHNLEQELFGNGVLLDQVIYANESFAHSLSGSDGVIILGRCSRALLDHIRQKNANITGIWRNSMDFNVDEVVCDGKKAAQLAVSHLLSLGHKNIAYIGDCSFESRYVGYCNTLIQNEIPIDYSIIKSTNQTAEEADRAMNELLEGCAPFSAVFCANDITAIRALSVLKEKRRRIRRNISVISIDDIEASQDTSPMLTTIHIPRSEMAHMAVALLLDRIRRRHQETVRIEFPCRIIQRESCHHASSAVS